MVVGEKYLDTEEYFNIFLMVVIYVFHFKIMEQYEIRYNPLIFFIIFTLFICIPFLVYWLKIRKYNIKLANEIDLIILMFSIMVIIGLCLSSIVRIEYYPDGMSWNYEIADIGTILLITGWISLMIIPIIFSLKYIKYNKWITIGKLVSTSILVIFLLIFLSNILNYWLIEFNNSINQELVFYVIQDLMLPSLLVLSIVLYRDFLIYSYGQYIQKKKGISIFNNLNQYNYNRFPPSQPT
jgi:hypothetical protein